MKQYSIYRLRLLQAGKLYRSKCLSPRISVLLIENLNDRLDFMTELFIVTE